MGPKGTRTRIPQKGVTGLIKHHKVAVIRSQPRPYGLVDAG